MLQHSTGRWHLRHRRYVQARDDITSGVFGEAKNGREAVGWLRQAAEQVDEENLHALHDLALLHEATNGQVVPHDPLQAGPR